VRVSKDQVAEMIEETDWTRIAAMTEADIERAGAEDSDASLTTPGDWKDARLVWPQTMEPVTLWLDRDVRAWFRRVLPLADPDREHRRPEELRCPSTENGNGAIRGRHWRKV
jgi:hypothetical protein